MSEKKNPYTIPGVERIKIATQLKSTFTFTNFIEGDYNNTAKKIGLSIAHKPGESYHNPFFIFSSNGLGKTHLVHAIGNETIRKFEKKIILYESSETFTKKIIEAIKNNTVSEFVAYYQSIDVLIIEDIQFLAGMQKTQEIFSGSRFEKIAI